ncbi:MAG: 50S ribosomal protein L17 [Planctomycetota bacterium]|jgi:large subunit ribosomal protein L17
MRHRKRGRKLGRKSNQRKALARSIARGFFAQFGVENREYIVTTKAKALEYRSFCEKLITLGRKAIGAEPARQVALRRHAVRLLPCKDTVKKIFDEVAPRYKDRQGGYTRVLKTSSYRLGDGSQKVLFAFVAEEQEAVAAAPKPIKKA